jgi:hypothetical protein
VCATDHVTFLFPPRRVTSRSIPSSPTFVAARLTLSHLQPSPPARRTPILAAEDSRVAQTPSADVTSMPASKTRCSTWHASFTAPRELASVWTTSLLGREFTVCRLIRATFRTFLYFLLAWTFFSLIYLHFHIPYWPFHHRVPLHLSHPIVYILNIVHVTTIRSNVLHFEHHCSLSTSPCDLSLAVPRSSSSYHFPPL